MFLAIDLGGTKTLLAVFDEDGKVVLKHKTPTDKSYANFIKSIDDALKNELKAYHFKYVCCAAPGLINHQKGTVTHFGNLDWQNVPLQNDLQKLFKQTFVLIENDAKIAALFEAVSFHRKYKKLLYLTVSTGIGAGIITNGKIDDTLINAEPGQMMLEFNGKIQKWEDVASGRALYNKYGKLARDITNPIIWDRFAIGLALGIEQLLATIQPDVVVVGGGVGAHFEKFSTPLHAELKKLESDMVPIPPIIKANRPEDAVIYGCYELIKQNF